VTSFCSDLARDAADIHGSATEAANWLCIEHPAPWAARELTDGSLPAPVTERIAGWEAAVPGLRTQAIRREVRTAARPGRVTVLLAHTGPEPWLRRLLLPSLDALLDVDVPALFDQGSPPHDDRPGTRLHRPVVLTCTNGKRDACCALKGRAFHAAMADIASEAAWQTTHLGGHRFAPTALVLPYGAQYGWLTPDDAPGLWQAAEHDAVYRLDRYRGAVGWPRPAQAAAIAARRNLGVLAYDAVADVDITASGPNTWRVTLTGSGMPFAATVRRQEGAALPKSCGAEPKPAVRYEVEVQADA
jgi:hypothetical protein